MTPKMSLVLPRWTLNSSNSIVRASSCHLCPNLMNPSLVHKDDISREQLKELLYEEIMSFRPPPMV